MKTLRPLILFAFLNLIFLTNLISQDLNFELKWMDLEMRPVIIGDPDQSRVFDDMTYFNMRNGSREEIIAFDGESLETLYTGDDNIQFMEKFQNGFFYMEGTIADTQKLFYLDNTTKELHLIHEFEHNFKALKVMSDKAFFISYNDDLFVTDGSPSGAQLLRHFMDIPSSEEIEFSINDLLVFVAENEVWRSDGTNGGTFKISDYAPVSFDQYFVGSGDFFYYTANDFINGKELWVSDGTVGGTMIVSDFNTGSSSANEILELNRATTGVIFKGETTENGIELWVSDGTVAGTELLIDIEPGAESGVADDFFQVGYSDEENGKLFFKAGMGGEHNELWVSDGTVAGTFPIIEFATGANYDPDWRMLGNNKTRDGKLFFNTNHLNNQKVLWSYYGDQLEATEIFEFPNSSGTSGIYPGENLFYFVVDDGDDQLWVTDGTIDGTMNLISHPFIGFLGMCGDTLFYDNSWEDQGTIGEEPYISDGTVEGTGLLKDINVGNAWSWTSNYFMFNGVCHFYAEDHVLGQAVYSTDGTAEGTNAVVDFYPNTHSSDVENLTSAGGKLYFLMGDILWVSDGTEEGSFSLNIDVGFLDIVGTLGDKVFIRDDLADLWVTDGTLVGTQLLLAGSGSSMNKMTRLGDFMYFFFNEENEGLELWRTDGTAGGTSIFFESEAGDGSNFISWNTDLGTDGTSLFFSYTDDEHGYELWKSDGTLSGTNFFKDLSPGSTSSNPTRITSVGDKVYFSSSNPTSFWVSDGTEEGTINLGEIFYTYPHNGELTTLGDSYVFIAFGTLWRSDGTLEGTFQIGDLPNLVPDHLTQFGNKIIFQGEENDNGQEPWVTDGTAEGTFLIKDINPTGGSFPSPFVRLNDYLYFTAIDETGDRKLWITDGTESGTLLFDPGVDPINNNGEAMPILNGDLYFLAFNPLFGEEIHFLDFIREENVRGNVFQDLNENGLRDMDESGIYNISLIAEDNEERVTFSNTEGAYGFFNLDGSYEIYPLSDPCWELTTDSTSYQVTASTEQLITDLDFGYKKIEGLEDIKVGIHSGPTRCGFTVPFWLNVYNIGCKPFSGEIDITLDELTEFISSDITPLEIDGQNLSWSIEDLAESSVMQIKLFLKMPTEESVGETFSIITNTYLLSEGGTLELFDEYNFESIISCAIDPNDKQVSPSRAEETNSNYTQFDEVLRYTIRFQNTGTDTAFTVRIVDQLSANLDYSTFNPLYASHPYRSTLDEGGRIEFLFENILLPDSIVNEPESHGFVTFEIMGREGLEDFTEIANHAEIYFDFNSPIITNEVINTMVEHLDFDEDGFYFWEDCNDEDAAINPDAEEIPDNEIDENCDGEGGPVAIHQIESGKVKIYPNPVSSYVQIELETIGEFDLRIYNAQGSVVLEKDAIAKKEQINLAPFPSGLYFLELYDQVNQQKVVDKIEKVN